VLPSVQSTVGAVLPDAVLQDSGYTGFGFHGWQSGPQQFPDLSQQLSQFRSLASQLQLDTDRLGELLSAALHQLEAVITIS